MYTSDEKRVIMLKRAFVYLPVTMFCALFGGIYEIFSHRVYSYYMIYAFAIPLTFGVLPFTWYALKGRMPKAASIRYWHYGVATLTVGSLVKGALYIYGTSNRMLIIYPVIGILFLLTGLVKGFLTRTGESAERACAG